MNKFSQLRATRQIARLSQDELGRRTGVDRARISRMEGSYIRPSLRERKALSRVLGVPAEVLFPASTEK